MPDLPPRVSQLKDEIVAGIPCRKPAHREHLAGLPFATIMNVYVNHASRLVVPRPRRVVIAPGFWDINDARRDQHHVRTIAAEIESGANLSPRLSSVIRFQGYRPDVYENGRFAGNKWWSRDFVLSAYGLHHLHLEAVRDPKAKRERSSRLLFVEFTRDVAVLVMLAGHDFDSPQLEERVLRLRADNDDFVLKGITTPAAGGYTPAERIQVARAGMSAYAVIDGKVVMSSMIASDGTSDIARWHRTRILQALHQADPWFDDAGWASTQFRNCGQPVPPFPRFEWLLQGTNLLMLERNSRVAFNVFEGRQGYAKPAA